jgi:hypothetical protein
VSNDSTLVDGEYRVNARSKVTLTSHDAGVFLRAGGEKHGHFIVDATNTASIYCGPALFSLANMDPLAGQVALVGGEMGTIKLQTGVPLAGALLSMSAEEVTISVGPPGVGASIKITPESITFRVAEVTYTMTPLGITEEVAEVSREMTPEGHNLTAAETELNVGLQGVDLAAPTEMNEVEGGNVQNETLGTHATDAVRNDDVGIEMME